jgi:predicted metal-dependent hydrolase
VGKQGQIIIREGLPMKKTRERMRQELEKKASEVIEKLLEWHDQHKTPDMTQIEGIVLALREEVGLEFAAKLIESQESTAPVTEHCQRCGREMRHKGKKRKSVESRVGEIVLEREYCYCAECSTGLFPPGSAVEGSGEAQE